MNTAYTTKDPELIGVLEHIRTERLRVHLFYDGPWGYCGDNQEWGLVGRSMGNPKAVNGGVKAPLLLKRRDSTGGGLLHDEHIIRIEDRDKRVLWSQEKA